MADQRSHVILTVRYAAAFPAMRINSVDPGYTATDLDAHRGEQSVEEGGAAIVRVLPLLWAAAFTLEGQAPAHAR